MIKQAIQIGNPKVRVKSRDVPQKEFATKKVKGLIKDLTDSMRYYGLVGMAAPQLGTNLNVFVSEIRKTKFRNKIEPDPLRVFINPKIFELSTRNKDMLEGCGTIDYGRIHGPVKRSLSLKIKAFNEKGEKFELFAQGLLAQIIQHEYDHLQGILCIDKFSNTRKIFYKEPKKLK